MGFVLIPEISEIRAENCGIAILNPGWTHKKRNLSTSVLILGHHGEVKLKEEGEEIRVASSRTCLLSEGRTHWGYSPIDHMARYFWIHFKSKTPPRNISDKEAHIILSDRQIARQRLSNSLLLPVQTSLPNSHTMKEKFQELLYEQQNKTFTEQKYQSCFRLMLIHLNEIVLTLNEHNTEKKENKSLVNKIIVLIYENLTHPDFSVKRLADMIGYNPDYLNRHFKSIMKQSLIEYIIDKRIEHCIEDLTDSDRSMTSIAERAGFSSYRNFVHQFKLRKNMVPSDFRNHYRTMHITNR